jgi:D-serine deaminase-like pyridoxal phosphate-dependent protein
MSVTGTTAGTTPASGNVVRVENLATPALLADLDVVDANMAAISRRLEGTGVSLRPHFKNHTVPWLALRQRQSGAIGMTVARLRHVELLQRHGIPSILIANEVVGEGPLRELAGLGEAGEVIAAVDNPKVVADMGRISRNRKVPIQVVVDVDLGLKRCGVPFDQALPLARLALDNGLRVRGLMGYEGHLQKLEPGDEKLRICGAASQMLVDARRSLEEAGIPVDIVSTAGSGTYAIAASYKGITEVQAGTYLLMEGAYEQAAPEFRTAISLLVTVISKTAGERVIVDAGSKANTSERGMSAVKNIPGLRLRALHAEHGVIDILDPSVPVEVGDKIELTVHYSDGTINLHPVIYGIRDGVVEQVLRTER